MKIYELRCHYENHGHYEDHEDSDSAIGFYTTKQLAEKVASNADALKIINFEHPRLVKEFTKEEIDKKNSEVYYISASSEEPLYHHYIRAFQIVEAYDDDEDATEYFPWETWDLWLEVIEHELVGAE